MPDDARDVRRRSRKRSDKRHSEVSRKEDSKNKRLQKRAPPKRKLYSLKILCNLIIHLRRKVLYFHLNNHEDELTPYIRYFSYISEPADEEIELTEEQKMSPAFFNAAAFRRQEQVLTPTAALIFSKNPRVRTEAEVRYLCLALKHVRRFSEYPRNIQMRMARSGIYQKFGSKRVVIRQGHIPSGYYIVLSGSLVEIVVNFEKKYAKPTRFITKGEDFGSSSEEIQLDVRLATVLTKENTELLWVPGEDYREIFHLEKSEDTGTEGNNKTETGDVEAPPSASEKSQLKLLKHIPLFQDWPLHLLAKHPSKNFFKFCLKNEVLEQDTSSSKWMYVVVSGQLTLLKKLLKVTAFQQHKDTKKEPGLPGFRGSGVMRQFGLAADDYEAVHMEARLARDCEAWFQEARVAAADARDARFREMWRQEEVERAPMSRMSRQKSVVLPEISSNNWFSGRNPVDADEEPVKLTRYKTAIAQPDNDLNKLLAERDCVSAPLHILQKSLRLSTPALAPLSDVLPSAAAPRKRSRRASCRFEDPIEYEFVRLYQLGAGDNCGLVDILHAGQTPLSLVSQGAEVFVIERQFYAAHLSDGSRTRLTQEVSPYPTEIEMQNELQNTVDWAAQKKKIVKNSLYGTRNAILHCSI